MWHCSECGETIDDDFEVCGNCCSTRADLEPPYGISPEDGVDGPGRAFPSSKDRRVNICRIVAFRSAKAAFFRGAKGDTYFCAGPKPVGFVQLFAGVILPLICFAISYPMVPDWQSGRLDAYARLLLSHKASVPLYPFLLYCMICMTLLYVKPARFRGNAWVRFGIFSGVIVAAEYWVVFQAAADDQPAVEWAFISALAAIVPWGAWKILGLVFGRYRKAVTGVVAIALAVFCIAMPGAPIFFCLWCSTPWALASYAATSYYLIRGSGSGLRFSLAQLLGFVTWFAAHCGAWRLSFLWMLEEYSRLPTQPSGCFVCTAVAHGHPRVVRGEDYLARNGMVYRVNDQLRVLKAFELLLMSFSPKSHRACRWIYDRLGPRLAAKLVHPALADVGYFALKPFEWLALVCLGLAIRGKLGLVYRLYPKVPNWTIPKGRFQRYYVGPGR